MKDPVTIGRHYVPSEGRDGFSMINAAATMSSAHLVFYYQVPFWFPVSRKQKSHRSISVRTNDSVEFSQRESGSNTPGIQKRHWEREMLLLHETLEVGGEPKRNFFFLLHFFLKLVLLNHNCTSCYCRKVNMSENVKDKMFVGKITDAWW